MPMPLSPEATTVDTGKQPAGKIQSADDINQLFGELDDEPGDKTPPKGKEADDDDEGKGKEDDDDDLEFKEPDDEEEKLDLKDDNDLEIDAPPRKKEILKEYPELFKKFPFLEKMLYRDRQYSELFGSFDDAKDAAERVQSFNELESQLMSGNTVDMLKEIKETDDKAFKVIVDDYLGSLIKVDRDAYFHVVGNLNKRLIMEMVAEGNKTNNEDLKKAALLVNQYCFGTSEFTPPSALVDKSEDPKKAEIEKERLSFVQERYETARDDLQAQADNTIRATISEYIDPRGNMSPYVKKNAINDAMNYLGKALSEDPTIIKNLDSLWRAAFDAKFSRDSLGKIKSYYLSKAKRNLRDVIIKARADALKDSRQMSRKEDEEEEEVRTPVRRQSRDRINPGRPSQPKGKHEMRKGESVADFFARD